MKLMIVESPAKARKIKTFLGSEYQVEASMGHIREIPPKGLNIDIKNNFEPKYEVSDGKEDIVKTIKSYAKKSDMIYLASDGDREGEFIALSIHDLLDKESQKKCKRVTYNEITKKAILEAISKARDIDMDLVAAQKARQVLDRLIGYKISPLCWTSVAKGTSAGRVQSIALKLICDRQKEIEAFVSTKYWFVEALLKCDKGSFWAKVVVPKSKDNRFLKEEDAKKSFNNLKTSTFLMKDVEKSSRQVKPNPPFDTNSLQVACSSIYKWNASKTMSAAQGLYEAGHISYIRSDSFNISQEALADVRSNVENLYGKEYLSDKPNVYEKKSKVAAQEAHECIRPTHVENEGESLSGDDAKLYRLIRDRFIACQMKPMEVDVVTYHVKASLGDMLIAAGQRVSFDGFGKVWKHTKIDEETLPVAAKGDKLDLEDSKLSEKKTEPPDRYNDGSLVKKMEKEGVGRPSTWASIIKTLEGRKYVSHDKTAIVPTPLAMKINDFLSPSFKDFFMDVQFTAGLEEDLDKIAEGKMTFLDVVKKVYDKMVEEIKKVSNSDIAKTLNLTGEKCSVCKDGDILERFGKNGMFYTCSKYPDCKTIFEKTETGFKTKDKKPAAKQVGRKCPKCDKPLVERTSPFGHFVGCSGYPGCKFIERQEKKNDDSKNDVSG